MSNGTDPVATVRHRALVGVIPALVVGLATLGLGFGPRLLNAAVPAEYSIEPGAVLHAGVGYEYTPDPSWRQVRGLSALEDHFVQASRVTDGTVELDARAAGGSSLPDAYRTAAERLAERHDGAQVSEGTPFTNTGGLAGLRGEVTGADSGVLVVYFEDDQPLSVTALSPDQAGLGGATSAVDTMIDSVREKP